jgi:histidine triad (HIT) family protein
MQNCIFCSIVDDKLPAYKIHENEKFIAFLDIFPRVEGHALVIPKKHYRYVYDVPEFGEYFEFAKVVSLKIQRALDSKYISFVTVGEEVHHAHIHILPQTQNNTVSGITFQKVIETSNTDFEKLSQKIRQESF